MKVAKPLQVKAYESLKAMILSGEFEYRQTYSETKLSRDLGISRTPLRDAIHTLASEGYLDVIPSKGFRLHELTEQDLLETYQIRCALEGFCVVQLARNCESPQTQELIDALEKLLRSQEKIMETSRSILEFARYDEEFHKRIVYSLENSVISSTFDNIHNQISRQIILSLRDAGCMEEAVQEHRAIVENIKSGATDRSYEAALAHLEKPKGIIHLDEIANFNPSALEADVSDPVPEDAPE